MDPNDIDDPSLFEPSDSPCKLICAMDMESHMCMGCGRTRDEIANWTLKPDAERQRILAELPARMPPLTAKLEARRSRRRVTRRTRKAGLTSTPPQEG